MTFESDKKTIMGKIDKSREGQIDKGIRNLVNKLNQSGNYYTTSSCSGRIVILARANKKQETDWLLKSHDKLNYNQVKKALKQLPKSPVWFRFEPLILHVASRSIEDAQILVNKAREIGFKRTGIQSIKRNIVEIASTEFIDTIIADKGKLLVDDSYLKILIKEANKKLDANKMKISKFSI